MGYVATQQFCKKMLGVKVQIKPSIRDALADKTSVPVKKMTVSQPVMLQQPAPVEGKSGKKKSQKKQPKQITVQTKQTVPTVKTIRKLLLEIDPEIQSRRCGRTVIHASQLPFFTMVVSGVRLPAPRPMSFLITKYSLSAP